MAVVGQRWVGPSTSDALDLLFLRPGTRMNFDVELADCIERSSSWGELLIKAALSVCEPSRAESHERKYGVIRSDVRALLKTCRLDLFDLKRDVWEERKWLVKDELSLKKLFRKFLSHDDFADALASLDSVGGRKSVTEAWMSLFVMACRYRESHGMVDVLKGFNLIKSKDVVEMRPYRDVRIAHSRASMSEDPVREIRALHHLNDEAIRSSSVIRILEDYFRWWKPYEQGKDGYFYSAAEYVIFPSKASCDTLLFVVLKSLGFVQDNKNSFGISSLDFRFGFLHRA